MFVCFLDSLCRQKQSIQQIGALFLLIMAAVLLSIGEGSSKGSTGSDPDQVLFSGIIPILVASVLSGLASALCQWASQVVLSLNCDFSECIKTSKFYPSNTFYRLRNTRHT